ncbi:flagellar motor protein MotD [Porticoccus sp.]|jgi:chemotaxis protein MotB|uniref:flagellar motor protein MotD n=1 Tax=Porticoccus sp. TaxID=2024853 RepID=UPI000C374E07|nr:flagellar motor protein MotD [Porticoccus sp.]MAZ70615.1 flagellar motor protein MotD [Porticoccus sp.]|tara:strand:- start:18861 stop:19760 length:900 start_codon:yes stop_codon:yes gene_type:complete
MARKKLHQENENHERWLVSYADFITLLFAFFVVMYSISSVNEGKYRVLSSSMVSAFRQPKSSLEPVQIGQLVRSPLMMPDQVMDVSANPAPIITPMLPQDQDSPADDSDPLAMEFSPEDIIMQKAFNAAEKEVDEMAGHVEEQLDSLIDEEIVNIKRNKFWLEVEIKSSLLFPSGGSDLVPASIPVLQKLSKIFRELPNRIHVEGFTDNQPINTVIFPSNWELSTARAAAVVRLFESNGIAASRMAAIGYGEFRPIAENTTETGRAKNRRVVIVVVASMANRQDQRIYEFEMLKDQAGT